MDAVLTIKMAHRILFSPIPLSGRRDIIVCVLRSEDNLKELTLSFQHVGSNSGLQEGLVEDTSTCWAISTSSLTKFLEYLITKSSCYLATAKSHFLTLSLRSYNTINTQYLMIPWHTALLRKHPVYSNSIFLNYRCVLSEGIFPGGQC